MANGNISGSGCPASTELSKSNVPAQQALCLLSLVTTLLWRISTMAKVFPSIKAQLRDPGGRGADDLALNTGSELTSAPGNHAVLLNYRSSQPGWGCVQLGGSVCVLGFWGKFEVQTGLMAIYSWPSSRHSTKFLQFYFGKLLAAFGNYFYFKDTVPWCFAVGMCICRANSECEKMAGDFIQPQWAGNASHLRSFVQFLSTAKGGDYAWMTPLSK